MIGKVFFLAALALAAAKPGVPAALVAPAPYVAAPLVAAPAPIVTASSSQYIARNYNGVVSAPVAAPLVAAPAYYSARYLAPAAQYYSAPLSYAYAPSAPLIALK
ncbi:unnamed protein product [Colias eurytheme]|nr:unnamed protein product [Colias eurytheme]